MLIPLLSNFSNAHPWSIACVCALTLPFPAPSSLLRVSCGELNEEVFSYFVFQLYRGSACKLHQSVPPSYHPSPPPSSVDSSPPKASKKAGCDQHTKKGKQPFLLVVLHPPPLPLFRHYYLTRRVAILPAGTGILHITSKRAMICLCP